MGVIRHSITFIGGLLITFGTMDQETVTQIIGGIMAAVSFTWSVNTNNEFSKK